MKLTKHLPSHMAIAGYDTLISYDGQPPTCYRCNEKGHQEQHCPRRKRVGLPVTVAANPTWADIIAHDTNDIHPAISKTTHGTYSGESTILINEPPNMQINTQPQDNHITPDTQWTSSNPVEHKQDGQDNICTETSQTETSETHGCNEATNNIKTLNGGTNHQQVLHKHNGGKTEVENSEPNSGMKVSNRCTKYILYYIILRQGPRPHGHTTSLHEPNGWHKLAAITPLMMGQ
jgi:hypothetical protein